MRVRAFRKWLAAFGCVALVGCAETRRSNGDDCVKGEDCLSGVCSGLKCVAPPPILDAAALDAPFVVDAGSQAPPANDAAGE